MINIKFDREPIELETVVEANEVVSYGPIEEHSYRGASAMYYCESLNVWICQCYVVSGYGKL